jgi:hypothetical protein
MGALTAGRLFEQLEHIVGRRDEAAVHLDAMQDLLKEHQKAADQVAPTYKPLRPFLLGPSPRLVSPRLVRLPSRSSPASKEVLSVKKAAWS